MTQTKQICPGCTLLCDDIEIVKSDSKTVAKNACPIGETYFQISVDDEQSHFVSGKPAELDQAIATAAGILTDSTAPLICGLDQLTTQAQQSAWKLADGLGATIDTTLTNSGRASMFALQRVGKVTASLGEVANRSDLILFWFCDPATTHPRLLERLSKSGSFPDRRIVVVDQTETNTAAAADRFVQFDKDSGPATLAALRAQLAGSKIDASCLDATGISGDDREYLYSELTSANYGCVFYGQPETDSQFDLATDSLSRLVRSLNNVTRFVGLKLRSDANAQSGENVLAWSTGYPFAVNHSLNYPRFNWLEHSAESVLARGECDSILFATRADLQSTIAGLSRTARDHFGSIPKIALSPIAGFPSDVSFQVGVPGLNEIGEYCRLDDVSLRLSNPIGKFETSAQVILDRLFSWN